MSKKMVPEREIICVVFNTLWFTRAVIYSHEPFKGLLYRVYTIYRICVRSMELRLREVR